MKKHFTHTAAASLILALPLSAQESNEAEETTPEVAESPLSESTQVVVQVEYILADRTEIAGMLDAAPRPFNAALFRNSISPLLIEGQATLAESALTLGRLGQQSSSTSVTQFRIPQAQLQQPTNSEVSPIGEITTTTAPVGCELVTETATSDDGDGLDVSISATISRYATERRRREYPFGSVLPTDVVEPEVANHITSAAVRLRSGEVSLLDVTGGAPVFTDDPDLAVLVFASAAIQPVVATEVDESSSTLSLRQNWYTVGAGAWNRYRSNLSLSELVANAPDQLRIWMDDGSADLIEVTHSIANSSRRGQSRSVQITAQAHEIDLPVEVGAPSVELRTGQYELGHVVEFEPIKLNNGLVSLNLSAASRSRHPEELVYRRFSREGEWVPDVTLPMDFENTLDTSCILAPAQSTLLAVLTPVGADGFPDHTRKLLVTIEYVP